MPSAPQEKPSEPSETSPSRPLRGEDLNSLQLLTAIAEQQEVSQRTLAHRLGMAVGLVNAFVKRFARKGYIKIATLPARRMKYLLTPRGAAEKLRLTYEFLSFSYRSFREAHRNASNLFRDLARAGVKRLVFYGAEDLAEVAALSLEENGLELVAIVDDEAVGKVWLGRTVIALEGLDEVKFDRIVLTTIARRGDAELFARLEQKGEVLRIY